MKPTLFLLVVVAANLVWPLRRTDVRIIQVLSVVAIFLFAYSDEPRRRRDAPSQRP